MESSTKHEIDMRLAGRESTFDRTGMSGANPAVLVPHQGSAPLLRAVVANVSAEEIAALGQSVGLNGYALAGIGFGPWGLEPCSVIESATHDIGTFLSFVQDLLATNGEAAAFLAEIRGTSLLLWSDGRLETIPLTQSYPPHR